MKEIKKLQNFRNSCNKETDEFNSIIDMNTKKNNLRRKIPTITTKNTDVYE